MAVDIIEPKVTVLMTTYNGCKYINEAINSILNQTMTDFELLIVDDSSVDNTVETIEQYADPRIRLIRSDINLGVVGARNLGVTKARGKYIASLDHDDISMPERLEKQAAFLDNHEDVVAVSCFARDLLPGRMKPQKPKRKCAADSIQLEWSLLLGNPLVYSCLMVRKTVLHSIDPFMIKEYEYADDYDLYHRLMRIGKIVQLPEYMLIYRYHKYNTYKNNQKIMEANASRVLADALRDQGFQECPESAAEAIILYCSSGRPVHEMPMLLKIAFYLKGVRRHFVFKTHREIATDDMHKYIDATLSQVWARLIRASVRSGNPLAILYLHEFVNRDDISLGFLVDNIVSLGLGCVRALRSRHSAVPVEDWGF